jgi:hypothetical protein
MRAYAADNVKVKIQSGATEEQHQVSIHGVKWLSNGSGFGKAGNSGWRNFQSSGISEQFSLQTPMNANLGQTGGPASTADYLYSVDVSRDGWWTGVWGVMRVYGARQNDLFQLPNNSQAGGAITFANTNAFRNIAGNRVCPVAAPLRTYSISAVLANNVLPNANGVVIPTPTAIDPLTGRQFGAEAAGGPLNPGGGTLVYNGRGTAVPQQTGCLVDVEPLPCPPGQEVIIPGGTGPLNDPTAMMYVRTADLDPNNGGRLRVTAPVEPLVLRANAGDCIRVDLTNRLPTNTPDLAGWSDLMWMVNRQLFVPVANRDAAEMHFFGNNLVQPSAHVGMTPQLVEYDITRSDGMNVGINPAQTAAPGQTRTYAWYAGDLQSNIAIVGGRRVATVTPVPVEFGGVNLMPADKVKQGQKALVGSLVIEPAGATVAENTQANDNQANQSVTPGKTRLTRANVTVTSPVGDAGSGGIYREAVLVNQKSLNHRYRDGTAARAFLQGELGIEGAEDAGHMAMNYGSEPAWFRYKLPPDGILGNAGPGSLGGVLNADQFYSNALVAAEPNALPGGEPATPVFTTTAGQATRIHMLTPFSTDRDSAFTLHGHVWQRDPYVCTGATQDASVPLPGRCDPRTPVPALALGLNPQGKYMGGEEGMGHAMGHWPILINAGGGNAVAGDYLFRDHASQGNSAGLWGILRVVP